MWLFSRHWIVLYLPASFGAALKHVKSWQLPKESCFLVKIVLMYVYVCAWSTRLDHMAAICEASVAVGRKFRERNSGNTWSEESQKRPVQLAGMYLPSFYWWFDILEDMRNNCSDFLWAAMDLSLVILKQKLVHFRGKKDGKKFKFLQETCVDFFFCYL